MQVIASQSHKMSQQLNFPVITESVSHAEITNASNLSNTTFVTNKTLPIHRWVPWIAGFSSSFVKDALKKHSHGGIVLDPFAGVGTTLLDSILEGCQAIGFEINPYAALACRVKTSFDKIDLLEFATEILNFEKFYEEKIHSDYIPKSTVPLGFKTRHIFYSSLILRKVLILQDFISSVENEIIRDVFRLAFASNMIKFSNYSYEPSLGTRMGAGKEDLHDFPVGRLMVEKLNEIIADLKLVNTGRTSKYPQAQVINDTFFKYEHYLRPESIELIITSPPYLIIIIIIIEILVPSYIG